MSEEDSSIKIVFLGDSGVGKTSIITKFITGSIPDVSIPTIGASFVSKSITIDGKEYQLLIFDTAGQELYRGLAPMYYRNASIAIICFDVTVSTSFNSVSFWAKELHNNCDESMIIVICGNKADKDGARQIEYSFAESKTAELGGVYTETSALTGAGVERLFQLGMSQMIADMETKKKKAAAMKTNSVDISTPQPQKKEGGCC